MDIVYVYQRKRKDFGRQPVFSTRPAESYADIPPNPEYMTNYVKKSPCSIEIQAAPEMSEHEVNTESFVLGHRGILHKEGGWPKDVDPNDVEHVIRYRKKVEKADEYIKSVNMLGETMEHCIKQNNAIDIYQEYFTDNIIDMTIEAPAAKTLNVYRDPSPVKRPASFLSWYPDGGRKLAVAYSILAFQQFPENMPFDSYIWDIENPNAPDSTITPPSPLVVLKYNPKDPHTLVGGCYNGLIAYWDVRKGPHPVDVSSVEKSHQDPVYNIAWMQSKTGSDCFSVSTDGQVLWWDVRKLSEPIESMQLDPEKNGKVVGGTVLDFETNMPTKFMVGAENGSIFSCNRKAKNPSERIVHTYVGHHGPVCALQRNPFFQKNFLTVGDWTAKIWNEEVRTPIMSTKYHRSYLTDGCWSPTRPAVFFTSKRDGTLDIWDYVFKQNEPALTIQVSDSDINTVKVQDYGRMVAVGAADGSVTLLELSDGLTNQQPNEKSIFSQMLDREAKREKTLESATRDRKTRGMATTPTGPPSTKRPSSSRPDSRSAKAEEPQTEHVDVEDLIKRAEEDFARITHEELEKMAKKREEQANAVEEPPSASNSDNEAIPKNAEV